MKRILSVLACWGALVSALPWAARGQDASEETQWIAVLQSDHSPREKDAACARLKWIGTARSVPALAALLTDDQLSQSARYVLESMPGPEAGAALRQALAKTSGSNAVGIISSLGARGEAAAVPDLAALLGGPDEAAAAAALARIGGPGAMQALQAAWDGPAAGAARDAVNDGLLACANRLLTNGGRAAARPVFQELYDHEKDGGLRLAAFRGLVLASGRGGPALMVKAISGDDSASQGAALQLASKVGGSSTTRAVAALLPKLAVPVQIAVLQALAQRGDRLAVPGIAACVASPDPDVRLAAITALGELRDGRVALALARVAAGETGGKVSDEERAAARQAVADLFYGPVTERLLKALAGATPALQLELIRALGARGDGSAAPKMLELAQGGDDAARSAALQALALLAGPAQVPGLVQLVVHAANDDARAEAADALGSACQHIESQKGGLDASALVQAVQAGPLPARLALLGVCSGVSDARVREVLRAARDDRDERVSVAALRAICSSQDEQLLPDILVVARLTKAENFRMLGMRGCVRLITQDQAGALPVTQKMDTLKALLDACFNVEGKRLVLSGLASVADLQALALAESLLDDGEVKVEAADAVVEIARAVSDRHPAEAGAALQRVVAKPANVAVRKSAQAALKKIKPAE